jgi:hypothetical protein
LELVHTNRGIKRGSRKNKISEDCSFTEGSQHCYVLSKFPKLEEEIIEILNAHRKVGQPLFAATICTVIRTLIRKKEPSLLEHEGKTTFKVSLAWTRDFVR